MQLTVASALDRAVKRLTPCVDSARVDAEVLLGHLLSRPRSYLYAWSERPLTALEQTAYEALVARRQQGEPVAYLTGRREFWSLDLEVTPETLIPRPETELLVELALARLPEGEPCSSADLGTGSGAVALALASERPQCRVLATDNSGKALAVARRNATRLGLGNVAFAEGEWCKALGQAHFRLIASNPPYVAAADPHLDRGDLRFEPATALVSGAEGLDAIRAIATCVRGHLLPGGWLLCEHGYAQAAAVGDLLRRLGYHRVCGHRDLAGLDRVTEAQWPGVSADAVPRLD